MTDLVKPSKSIPTASRTALLTSLILSMGFPGAPVMSSNSLYGAWSLPSALPRARRWDQRARYLFPPAEKITSEKQFTCCRLMISLPPVLMLESLGVWP